MNQPAAVYRRDEVRTITKHARQQVRVALATRQGHQSLDVRLFVLSKAGEFVPTPKGVTLPFELIHELQQALVEVRRAASTYRSSTSCLAGPPALPVSVSTDES
jgi:transcriptional coactivator p15 (PC4)